MIGDLIWFLGGLQQATERACDKAVKERHVELKASVLASLKPGDVLPGGELMVVPAEATVEMCAAGRSAGATTDRFAAGIVYRAMLAAAKDD